MIATQGRKLKRQLLVNLLSLKDISDRLRQPVQRSFSYIDYALFSMSFIAFEGVDG